jgi:hypothetical protein
MTRWRTPVGCAPTERPADRRDDGSIAARRRPDNVYTPPREVAPASLDRRHVVACDWLAERLVRMQEQRGRATRRVLSCPRPQRRRRQPT